MLVNRVKGSGLQLVSELCGPSLEERSLPLATTCAHPDLSLLHCAALWDILVAGHITDAARRICGTKHALVKWLNGFLIPHLWTWASKGFDGFPAFLLMSP